MTDRMVCHTTWVCPMCQTTNETPGTEAFGKCEECFTEHDWWWIDKDEIYEAQHEFKEADYGRVQNDPETKPK